MKSFLKFVFLICLFLNLFSKIKSFDENLDPQRSTGIYIGGTFSSLTREPNLEIGNIARWDVEKSEWSFLRNSNKSLISGVDAQVRAIVSFPKLEIINDNISEVVFIGGDFKTSLEQPSINISLIAIWNQTQQSFYSFPNSGGGLFGQFVSSLLVFKNNYLFIGGSFNSTFDNLINFQNLAIWNIQQSNWESLIIPSEIQFDEPILKIDYDRWGNVWLITAHKLIRFNFEQNQWENVIDNKINYVSGGTIMTIAIDQSRLWLLIGGSFTSLHTSDSQIITISGGVLRYIIDPSLPPRWSVIGSGTLSQPSATMRTIAVHSIINYNSIFYIGGSFSVNNPIKRYALAQYDEFTSSWVNVPGASLDQPQHLVNSLIGTPNNWTSIFFGGSFANPKPFWTNNILSWESRSAGCVDAKGGVNGIVQTVTVTSTEVIYPPKNFWNAFTISLIAVAGSLTVIFILSTISCLVAKFSN
eukprot:TRINITY_DN2361_c0_g1_i1.p1 TRINITY_DN2361_c0_g1~~TRINITY_DN2361_c0_g1_i1.p1  ORF type:complete len:471 (-),score=220.93 TRINITY_DN2361_c0_g1_i1:194-1606(-)